MAVVSFDRTKGENDTILKIATRASEAAQRQGVDIKPMHFAMDISACHANGNPLRLKELLEAKPFDFTHDVFGIYRHINRDTGKLENHFRPRFSK